MAVRRNSTLASANTLPGGQLGPEKREPSQSTTLVMLILREFSRALLSAPVAGLAAKVDMSKAPSEAEIMAVGM